MTVNEPERSDQISILVVDDNEKTRKLIAYLLEQQAGWLLLKPAFSGEEVLQLPDAPAPDLLFLDYDMPGMTGLKVLPLLRSKWTGTYIIVLTHFDDELVRKAALTIGADDFWSKWDLDENRMHELVRVVRERISGRRP